MRPDPDDSPAVPPTYVLTEDCPARDALTARLSALIGTHPPAEHQNFTPGAGLWAAVARSAVMDPQIPAQIVYRTLTATDTVDRVTTTFRHFLARQHALKTATSTAFDTIRQHSPGTNNTTLAEQFGVSRTT